MVRRLGFLVCLGMASSLILAATKSAIPTNRAKATAGGSSGPALDVLITGICPIVDTGNQLQLKVIDLSNEQHVAYLRFRRVQVAKKSRTIKDIGYNPAYQYSPLGNAEHLSLTVDTSALSLTRKGSFDLAAKAVDLLQDVHLDPLFQGHGLAADMNFDRGDVEADIDRSVNPWTLPKKADHKTRVCLAQVIGVRFPLRAGVSSIEVHSTSGHDLTLKSLKGEDIILWIGNTTETDRDLAGTPSPGPDDHFHLYSMMLAGNHLISPPPGRAKVKCGQSVNWIQAAIRDAYPGTKKGDLHTTSVRGTNCPPLIVQPAANVDSSAVKKQKS